MILVADIDAVGMHLVRKHDINYIDALSGRFCSANVHYISVQHVPTLHTLKNYCEQYCERDMENIWEDWDVDDVQYVLGNPRKRDINDVRISPVRFLRDRELGVRGEKYGIVITEPVSDWSLLARQKVYRRLQEKYMENHERMERKLLEQCGQVATLVECFAWLQRCDECIKRQSYSVMTSVSPLDTDNPWWRGSRDSRVQRHNWSDVLCTLVASTRVASTRVATKDLSSDKRSTPRLKAVY
ncbi:hypothetical protein ALC57_00087 [Trachymyrmex cornetzi]|uniref:Uncharacterized protein n=1 Tax=Trachymyrmex cornetzi TaxID=471704 RepID=A0A151K2U5_9HYME|nr:hypothetical protein ALC57_00087 [Trachymyrmex cornetzi]